MILAIPEPYRPRGVDRSVVGHKALKKMKIGENKTSNRDSADVSQDISGLLATPQTRSNSYLFEDLKA